MEIDRHELKRQAREGMRLAQPPFWVVTFVYLLLTAGVEYLFSAIPGLALGFGAFFLWIFLMLYRTVVDFGLQLWALWTTRRLNPGLGALVQGFSVAGRVVLMEIMIALRLIGWSFLLSVCLLPLVMIAGTVWPAVTLLGLGGVYVAIWVLMLRYALAPFLLADRPDDGAGAPIRRSVSLTQGWKWELFKLEFSFIGWFALSFVLSSAALVFCLWREGFFQALFAFPVWEFPSLVSEYLLWQSGTSLELFNLGEQHVALFNLYYTVSNSLGAALAQDIATLPVLLFLLPYHTTARAGFYCHRLKLQQELAPPV